MNLEELLSHYRLIKEKGFIKSQRKGDCAVGNTFEDELGLKENNISAPDIEDIELKVKRKGASGLLTLFNKEGEWQMKQIEFLEEYGFPHTKKKGEISGYSTITKKPNKQGYYYDSDDENLYVKVNGVIIVKWDWNVLVNQFGKKFPNCIKVLAETIKDKGTEYFHYNEIYLYKGTTKQKFRELIENDLISIDFRLRTRYNESKSVRNHGTGFRIDHENMDKLFIKEALE